MFLASAPKPIEPVLKETVDKIEQQSPGLSVLAARQFRYSVYQATGEVTVSEPRNFNVLEEFILRAGIELSPPPTVDELASVLGLDPVFVQNTTMTLRSLQTLAYTPGDSIALTPQGRQFYEQGCVPQPPQTKQIYAVADPLNGNLIFLSSPLDETKVDLPDLNDFVPIEDRLPDSFSLTLEELQQIVQASSLGLHVPEEGKILTSFTAQGEDKIIWQTAIIFAIFDAVEDEVKLQVRWGRQILEDATNWLNNLQAEGKVDLNALCELSAQTITSESDQIIEQRNEEVEARIEQIEQIAIESVRESRNKADKNPNLLNAETGGVILLRDSQIRKAFLDSLKSASQNILIFSPWVSEEVVDDEFIRLLQNLAKRDVSILIGYGIARKQEDEERLLSEKVEQKLQEIITSDGLPAVQIFWLGNSHAKEVVVDKKVHLCGSHNWLSYRGDRLPRGETVYKVTTPEQVEEAYEFLANRFKKHAQKLWNKAVKSRNSKLAVAPICVWGALSMEEEALKQLQENHWLELLPVWLKLVCQGLKSQKISPDSACLVTALSLLSQIAVEAANIELLREGWRQVMGAILLTQRYAIASAHREAALNLLTDEVWSQFTRLGIAQPSLDSPEKFILNYIRNPSKKPDKQPAKKQQKSRR